MRKEVVFGLQGVEIGVGVSGWFREESGGTDDDGVELYGVVGMARAVVEIEAHCRLFEWLRVDAETEGTCQSHDTRVCEVAVKMTEGVDYVITFLSKSFVGSRLNRVGREERGNLGKFVPASERRRLRGIDGKSCIEFHELRGQREEELRNRESVVAHERGVVDGDNMQDNVGVCGIEMVVVAPPVGRFDMNLDISRPLETIEYNLCIEEIRAGGIIQYSGVDYAYSSAVDQMEVGVAVKTPFPGVLHNLFQGKC